MGEMGGQSGMDPHDDLIDDDTQDVIDQIDGRGEGDEADVLAEKFSGDEKALAKAYAHLERRFGEQGRELGEIRGELRAAMRLMSERSQSGDGKPTDPSEAFLSDLSEQVEKGQIDLVEAFRKMMEITQASSNGRDSGALDREEKAEVWERFAEENPNAKRLEPLMEKIIRAQPNLIQLDKGARGLRKSLATVLEIAESRYRKARAKADTGRRGGRMDSGTSRRVRRPSQTRQEGAPRFSNEEFNQAIDSARQSGSVRDWSKPVGMILDTIEGFSPEED